MTNTGGAAVTFEFRSESERNELLPTLQNVFRKTIACVGCQTCEAQCNFGAISFKNKKIEVDAQRCRPGAAIAVMTLILAVGGLSPCISQIMSTIR